LLCWLPLGLGASSLTPPIAWFHAVEGCCGDAGWARTRPSAVYNVFDWINWHGLGLIGIVSESRLASPTEGQSIEHEKDRRFPEFALIVCPAHVRVDCVIVLADSVFGEVWAALACASIVPNDPVTMPA
jgi:hypothetical protein